MMISKRFQHIVLSLSFTLIGIQGIHGQYCGTLSTSIPENFLSNAQLILRNDDVDTVGLAVWVIENTLETEGLYDEFEQSLVWVNEKYREAGLHFFICEWIVENGDGQLDRTRLNSLNDERFQDHRLNIYLVQELVQSGFQLAGFGIFPWDGNYEDRYVAMIHAEIKYPQLMAHEFGHYYGLLHTHDHSKGYEAVLRTNCQTAGDLCCDTPADPGLGFHNMDGCNYIGSQSDDLGYYYFPLTDFIMSYAPFDCTDKFSFEQLDRMRATAQGTYPNMVHDCAQLPDIVLSSSTASSTLDFLDTLVIEVEVTHSFTEVQLTDLTLYLEREGEDLLIGQNVIMLDPAHPVNSHTLHATLPPGLADGDWNLKIKADAKREFIESDERNNDVNITLEIDNSRFRDAMLFPNPATTSLTLFYRNELAGGPLTIELVDMAGRLIRELTVSDWKSPYFTLLSISELVGGSYLIVLRNSRGEKLQAIPFVKL